MVHTFCSLAAACLAASLLPAAKTTLPAFCLGAAGAAPLLEEGRPGAAEELLLCDAGAACITNSEMPVVVLMQHQTTLLPVLMIHRTSIIRLQQ